MAPLPHTHTGRVLGRLPAQIPDRLREFSAYVVSPLPTWPLTVTVPVAAWNIDGNSDFGDCVCGSAGNSVAAAVGVLVRAFGPATPGTGDPVPTSDEVIAQYKALTGCVTAGDANDTGLVISAFLKEWATAPGLFGGNIIGGFAPVAVASVPEIKQAIAAYGFVQVGVSLPQSAEDQVNAAPTGTMPIWKYVGDAPIGGHCILFVGYDATYFYAYSWGMIIAVEMAWYQRYVAEIWAVIPQAFVEAGKGPEVNLAELQADIGSLDAAPAPPKPKRKPKPKPWWSWAALRSIFER